MPLSPELQAILDKTFRDVADQMVDRVVECAKNEAALVVIRALEDLAGENSDGTIDAAAVMRVKVRLAVDLDAKMQRELAALKASTGSI